MIFEAEIWLKFEAEDYEAAKQILENLVSSLGKEFTADVYDTWEAVGEAE